jgi:hypothetical protein
VVARRGRKNHFTEAGHRTNDTKSSQNKADVVASLRALKGGVVFQCILIQLGSKYSTL